VESAYEKSEVGCSEVDDAVARAKVSMAGSNERRMML